MKRSLAGSIALVVGVSLLPVVAPVAANAQLEQTPAAVPARHVEPVVMLGAQLPSWSRTSAQGVGKTLPEHISEPTRDAHNGTLIVPPDARTGAPIDQIAAYKWNGTRFEEIPVQIDERFPYFLANSNSNDTFGPIYSSTDEELTYEWDVEAWKMTEGECEKEYPEGQSAMEDPVLTLDDDDELVFMASDAGPQAPLGIGPPGTGADRQEIRIVDPRDPGALRFVYLFQRPGGSSFNKDNGYVDYERDANADEWIDRGSFPNGHPENIGSSNTSYGPNLSGTVCDDDHRTPDVVETIRDSNDRFPRDGVTVSTDTYQWRATGRWMVRNMRITKPGTKRQYGPDIIDRWKGRAFQQNPDSSISLVGFEDEQVNWEANSSLLGELAGPVRAVREIWGADSGTNVTKTETFYRDSINYRYRVRVHPIPPDGLYTSWDYNHDVAECYFNESHTDCIAVDGRNDDELNVDQAPTGQPAYFDATDPRHSKPLANLNWEQVSGKGDSGSLVYMFEMKNAQALENPAVVPYYRDDACFDDGTGDDPTPRQFPGEASTDDRVYGPELRPCRIDSTNPDEPDNWQQRQGCFACHGVHYFITNDTDNAFSPKPLTEIDGAQWQWAVPTKSPRSVGDAYANTAKTPLVATAALQPSAPSEPPPAGPMPDCEQDGPNYTVNGQQIASRKIEGYIPVAQDSATDATTLHFQVLFPACEDTDGDGVGDFAGPYPIVVDYSGYEPAIVFFDGVHRHFLSEGYAVAGVNIRGTACSGGKFDYFEPRQSKDGAEAIEYLAAQTYSTGRVGMVGKSYPGITQLFVAAQKPPSLKAIVPGHVFGDLYRDVPYPGGIQNTTFAAGWSAGRIYDQIFHGPGKSIGYDLEEQPPEQTGEPDPQCAQNQAQHTANPPLNPFVRALYNHYDGALFHERSPWYFADQIEAPTFLVESWQDEQVGSRATELTERFSPELEWRMLATNGDHGEYYGSDILPEIDDFLSYYLKQQVPPEDQVESETFEMALERYEAEAAVQLNWETGAGGGRVPAWKTLHETWPAPSTQAWRLNLTGDGLLTEASHAEAGGPASVEYTYKPGTGTQQRGGYYLQEDAQQTAPVDTFARWTETPEEGTYAMFQTRPLTEDKVLAGPASLDLWVSSTAVDTDFQVTMTEVRPDGQEVFVQQGWLRASHRALDESQSTELRPFQTHLPEDSLPLVPGEPTPVRIEVFPFGHAFRAGSAIRIYVEAPHVKPDLWGFALLPTPALNTIYTSAEFPSSLALPLLAGEVAQAPLPACNTDTIYPPVLRNQPCRPAVLPLPAPSN